MIRLILALPKLNASYRLNFKQYHHADYLKYNIIENNSDNFS